MSVDFTPLEAGMDRWVRLDKEFIGRDALAAIRDGGGPARRRLPPVDAADADAHGYEPIRDGEGIVGFVTSGGYGHRVQQSLAMAYVRSDQCAPRDGADCRDPRRAPGRDGDAGCGLRPVTTCRMLIAEEER